MSNKVLYFEGAGCAERGDVENCRIRTAFTNDQGKRIYLELSGMEVTKHTMKHLQAYGYMNIGYVDHCHEIFGEILPCERGVNFEYSKAGILDFVNRHLACSFDEIKVTDSFYGYRVHKDGGGCNFMEDYAFNDEKADAARKAYNKIDMEIREQLGEKYSKISLYSIDDNAITVRCYASDKSMREHGLDPEKRFLTILI